MKIFKAYFFKNLARPFYLRMYIKIKSSKLGIVRSMFDINALCRVFGVLLSFELSVQHKPLVFKYQGIPKSRYRHNLVSLSLANGN